MSSNERVSFRSAFRALGYRNYRLYFLGQGLSLVGTWVQYVALGWLVYKVTGSALMLGVVGFSSQIASFVLSPFAGVWVDRWRKHRILLVTQVLFMLQAFALAALALTASVQMWQIIGLSLFSGLVNAFDTPTRQAFVVDLIENRDDLSNAIALNSSMFNSARLVGPAVAGILIAYFGTGTCFLINGFSYLAVLVALLAMRVPAADVPEPGARAIDELKEGFAYTFGFPPVRSIILLLGLVSLASMPYSILLPVFAGSILRGGASTLGFLTAASGVGALAGATYLASRPSPLGLGKWIPYAAVLLGVALIGFSFSRIIWLSALLLVVVGFGVITQMASSNTILQTIVDDRMRGRVMSFYTMAFLGTAPFGSLFSGVIASRIGAPHTVIIGGLICAVGGAAFATRLEALRRLVRPIYCEKGVLPAHVCGVENVSETVIPPEHI